MKYRLPALLLAWLLAGCASSPAVAPGTLLSSAQEAERYVVVTLRNQAVPAVPRAGSTVRTYDVPSTYGPAPATRAEAKAVATAHRLREVSAWPIKLLGVHCILFELPRGASRDSVLAELRRDARVESAQAFHSFTTLSTAGDPYRSLQRNLDLMNVAGAHRWSRGENVRVAVIDTGVDSSHPDLAGRIVKQENFVDDGGRSAARERHGTAVAGIIAAVEDNGQGIIGIAPAAHLYALRACWTDPQNPARAVCNTLTLAKAIAAAIEARARIVNLSLTGPADPLLERLVEVGLRRGIIFVGASPAPGGAPGFPTAIAGVISVDVSGSKRSADAALFAPGTDVLTLVPDGHYDFLSGSSLAAASVTGGIALLLAREPGLQAPNVREILARSSRTMTTGQGTLASVNFCEALALLPGVPACTR